MKLQTFSNLFFSLTESELTVVSGVYADSDGDDDWIRADEFLSSGYKVSDDYLKDTDKLVISPIVNVSNWTGMRRQPLWQCPSAESSLVSRLGQGKKKFLHSRQVIGQ